MSPLGALYRREAARLRRRSPTMEPERIDRLVTLALARAFLDLDAEELAQALREGSPSMTEEAASDRAASIMRVIAEALILVADDRAAALETDVETMRHSGLH